MEGQIEHDYFECGLGVCIREDNQAVELDTAASLVSLASVAWSLMQLAWVVTALRPPKRLGVFWTYTIAFVTPIITEAPLLLLAIKFWSMRGTVGSGASGKSPKNRLATCVIHLTIVCMPCIDPA